MWARGLCCRRDLVAASAVLRMYGGGCRIGTVRCNRLISVTRCGSSLEAGDAWRRCIGDHGIWVHMKLRRGDCGPCQPLSGAGGRVWLLISSCEGDQASWTSVAACRVHSQPRVVECCGQGHELVAKQPRCNYTTVVRPRHTPAEPAVVICPERWFGLLRMPPAPVGCVLRLCSVLERGCCWPPPRPLEMSRDATPVAAPAANCRAPGGRVARPDPAGSTGCARARVRLAGDATSAATQTASRNAWSVRYCFCERQITSVDGECLLAGCSALLSTVQRCQDTQQQVHSLQRRTGWWLPRHGVAPFPVPSVLGIRGGLLIVLSGTRDSWPWFSWSEAASVTRSPPARGC